MCEIEQSQELLLESGRQVTSSDRPELYKQLSGREYASDMAFLDVMKGVLLAPPETFKDVGKAVTGAEAECDLLDPSGAAQTTAKDLGNEL